MKMLSTEQRSFLEEATLSYMEGVGEILPYLERRGIGEALARQSALGLVADPMMGHEGYKGRLAIPYLTQAGPVNMKFRCIQDHNCKEIQGHGKYISSHGLGTNLYGVLSYESAGNFMCITEGEFDKLILEQIGLPSMGVPGASNWKPYWTQVFNDFSRVYIFSDGDKAGQEFAERVMSQLDQAVNIPMPHGMDVTDVFMEYGQEFLTDKIKG